MLYVIVEFVSGLQPVLVDADLVLCEIAEREGLSLRDLSEQNGPSYHSTSVWNTRTEEMVAVYQPFKPLLD